jgi:hypothetical protein
MRSILTPVYGKYVNDLFMKCHSVSFLNQENVTNSEMFAPDF